MISTNALVVPDNAESTTIVGSFCDVTSDTIWCIRSGLPTDVPPNFMIFIISSYPTKGTLNKILRSKDNVSRCFNRTIIWYTRIHPQTLARGKQISFVNRRLLERHEDVSACKRK